MKLKEKLLYLLRNTIQNNRGNTKEEISMEELTEMRRQNPKAILLDVRSPQEYEENHLAGSILIPSYEISSKAERILLDKKEMIILYCQSGVRSKKAAKILKDLGYEQIYSLKGGLDGK